MDFAGLNEKVNLIIGMNTNSQYMIAFGVFLLVWITLKIFKRVILHRLKRLADKTKNDLDDIIVDYLQSIGWPFYFLIALYSGLLLLVIPDSITAAFDEMLLIFFTFYIIKGINVAIDYLTDKQLTKKQRENKKENTSIIKVFGTIMKGLVWVIGILTVLKNLGFDISTFITGLGVTGIAVAFGLQKVLEDIFSSFSIYFDKPFTEGDFIVIGEDSGTVKHIGLKTTRIQHLKGEELVVSNRELTSARIHNYKKMKKRRISFSFGVEYDTPVAKLKKIPLIVNQIIEKAELADLDRVHFKSLGDFSLEYEVVYFMKVSDYNRYMDTQQEINLGLMSAFEKEGIGFAFPTQTVFVKK